MTRPRGAAVLLAFGLMLAGDGPAAGGAAPTQVKTTTDPSVLRVNIHHLIIQAGDGNVRITELIVIGNKTDRTYVGVARPDGRRETLRFRLPAGAANLEYLEGLTPQSVVAVADGFVDTTAVAPGVRQIGFSYTVPSRGGRATVVRPLDYPTDAIEVLASASLRLTATPLTAQDPVVTEQGSFSRFSGQALGRGATVTLVLSGLPAATSWYWILVVAAMAGVVAAVVIYPLLRRRRRPGGSMPATREDLIKAIAALDDLHEAGGLEEGEYQRRRSRYKARLVDLSEAEEGDR